MKKKIDQEYQMKVYLDFCFELTRIGVDQILEGKAAKNPVDQIQKALLQIQLEFEKAEAMKRV